MSEQVSGIPQYRLLEELLKDFGHRKEELAGILKELSQCIFRPENLMVDYTAAQEGYPGLEEAVSQLRGELFTGEIKGEGFHPQPVKKNEGFMTAGQVQYVCRAGSYMEKGLPYTGSLRVLKVMMGYDYLWNQLRVKGGAYGCMCGVFRNGDGYFVSYRDPHLARTVDVYEQAAEYIQGVSLDERAVTQFIIGAVSDLDTPQTPAMKGIFSLGGYLTGLSEDRLQKERDELLATTADTIRGLAGHIKALMEDECLCVVGNGEKIKENSHMFLAVDNLFH